MTRLGRLRPHASDQGLTLVELLVASVLMLVIATVTLTVVRTGQGALNVSRNSQDINEEARQALNRMTRDMRQAQTVVTAVNPDGPAFAANGLVGVRFQSDFDGDGCIGGAVTALTPAGSTCRPYSSANPEDISYCYQPGSRELYVVDNQAGGVTPLSTTSSTCSGGQPLLAGNVSAFQVEYRSNQYRYDLDPSDGITTWRELDAAAPPIGNNNGRLDVELGNIDSAVLNLTVTLNGRQQVYRTQVDMRNASR